jgi:hypothetical protein
MKEHWVEYVIGILILLWLYNNIQIKRFKKRIKYLEMFKDRAHKALDELFKDRPKICVVCGKEVKRGWCIWDGTEYGDFYHPNCYDEHLVETGKAWVL